MCGRGCGDVLPTLIAMEVLVPWWVSTGEEHFGVPHYHLDCFTVLQQAQALGLDITLHAREVGKTSNS